MRLGALWEGVRKGVLAAGVLMEDVAADRVLSLLRERFEDEGEAGTASGAEDMFSVSVLRPPLTLALRRSARSLCSLKVFLLFVSLEVAGSGRGGTRKFEGGMVEMFFGYETRVVACGSRGDRVVTPTANQDLDRIVNALEKTCELYAIYSCVARFVGRQRPLV